MNFFQILIAVCSGTEVFPKLLEIKLTRCIAHLFFMAVICAVLITACRGFYVFDQATKVATWMQSHFGTMSVADNGALVPEKAGKDLEKIRVTADTSLLFDPTKSDKVDESMFNDSRQGVLWIDGNMLVWLKVHGYYWVIPIMDMVSSESMFTRWNVQLAENSDTTVLLPVRFTDSRDFSKLVQKLPKTKELRPQYSEMAKMGWLPAAKTFTISLSKWIFATHISQILFNALVFSIIFPIVYTALGRDALSKLSASSLFTIGVYTGLPVMLVASLFPALNLPFLDYQSVYILGVIGYMYAVFNRLQKHFKPKERPKRPGIDEDYPL